VSPSVGVGVHKGKIISRQRYNSPAEISIRRIGIFPRSGVHPLAALAHDFFSFSRAHMKIQSSDKKASHQGATKGSAVKEKGKKKKKNGKK
jgi:hypothetical protein